jgi:hypothetical protein
MRLGDASPNPNTLPDGITHPTYCASFPKFLCALIGHGSSRTTIAVDHALKKSASTSTISDPEP